MKFNLPGRLPGLNEIIRAAKQGNRNYQPYAKMKEINTSAVAWTASKLPRNKGKVNITITWYEKDRRRDPDNVMAGQKFILDGLVVAGIIKNDSQKYINDILHKFRVDRKNPRIEVEIEEVGEGEN